MTTKEVSKKIRTRKDTADKRFDEGLCLFFYPNNQMTFYAVAKKPMFNEKKGRMENNSY